MSALETGAVDTGAIGAPTPEAAAGAGATGVGATAAARWRCRSGWAWTVGAGALVAVGGYQGLWFLPFVAGLALGALGWRRRTGVGRALLACTGAALLGWGLPLLLRWAQGEPLAGTARTVAALAGLPALPAVTVAAALLVAVVQALVGLWLGRAVAALAPGRGPTVVTGPHPGAVSGPE